jgi:hypothetical protein
MPTGSSDRPGHLEFVHVAWYSAGEVDDEFAGLLDGALGTARCVKAI